MVTVKRMLPTNLDLQTTRIAVELAILNPRTVPVTVEDIDYAVLLSAGPLQLRRGGHLNQVGPILAGETVNVEFDERLNYPIRADVDSYLELLKADSIPAVLRGKIRLRDGTESSFERRSSLVPPNLPRFMVFDSQAATYESQGIDVTFYLRLVNENPFGVVVDAVEYAIELDGRGVSEGTVGRAVRLIPGAVQEFEVVTSVDEQSYGRGWKEKLTKGVLRFRMDGVVRVSDLSLPVQQNGQISLK
ncbi:MAG: LEA type 2 family protein [Myxococcota bacterium]